MEIFVGDDVAIGIGEGVVEGIDGWDVGTTVSVAVAKEVAAPQAAN